MWLAFAFAFGAAALVEAAGYLFKLNNNSSQALAA
jgi:hypothetical protein